MEDAIKILVVEDAASDVELIKWYLKNTKVNFLAKVTETRDDYIHALQTFFPDVILSDHSLPQFTGMEALRIRTETAPHIPFIIMSGSFNPALADDCLKSGADLYVSKENMEQVVRAILEATRKQQE